MEHFVTLFYFFQYNLKFVFKSYSYVDSVFVL
jgi:hypothetical protein